MIKFLDWRYDAEALEPTTSEESIQDRLVQLTPMVEQIFKTASTLSVGSIDISLSGHLKTGQRWSLQNRPTGMARDGVVLPLSWGSRQARFGAPTPRPALEDVAVMEQPIQHRSHSRAVAE